MTIKNILERERKRDTLDTRVEGHITNGSLAKFRNHVIGRGIYRNEARTDVSLLPRVITHEEHLRIQDMCRDITEASLLLLSEYLDNPETVPSTELMDFVKNLPNRRKRFSGVARYDLLKEGDDYFLIETNFFNASAVMESVESSRLLLDLFPDLRKNFMVLNPYSFAKRRFEQQGASRVLVLAESTKEELPYFVVESLKPLKVSVALENIGDYEGINFSNGNLTYRGVSFDSVYPRYLSGFEGKSDPLYKYQDLVLSILSSGLKIIDNWPTLLIEDKDLRALSEISPSLKPYLPETVSVEDSRHFSDFDDWVLKVRDVHGGKGVYINPDRSLVFSTRGSILQRKLHTNKFPVRTVCGKTGYANYDTGVYVSYDYDHQRRRLNSCEIAGYLSRFSLDSEIVNISQGGGLIPVLVERQ